MSEILTFDQLPKAVTMLTQEISELKQLLLEKIEKKETDQSDEFLTIQEAAKFLNLTVPTIYSKVSKNEIPVIKRSKRLYFSRTELISYLKEGRKKTISEIKLEAENYFSKKGGKNG